MPIIVKNKQWFGDVALQEAGSMEALFSIARLNGRSITDNLDMGETLDFDKEIIDREVVDYYERIEVFPATGMTKAEEAQQPGGIDYMQIETDFIVS